MESNELVGDGVTDNTKAMQALADSLIDKSKVTVKVPKRLSKSHEYVQWREFKLQTRKMPNGYWVTLAFIQVGNKLIFGASACSPYDEFVKGSAYNRAIGRARQFAFLLLTGKTISKGMRSLLYDPEVAQLRNLAYITGPDDPKFVLGLAKIALTQHDLYALVARNAERNALLYETARLRRLHGYRFDITVGDPS